MRVAEYLLQLPQVNFLIPEFSEKKDLVGEMGNGFFQSYPDAELITVKTRLLSDPRIVYFVQIKPLRKTIPKNSCPSY